MGMPGSVFCMLLAFIGVFHDARATNTDMHIRHIADGHKQRGLLSSRECASIKKLHTLTRMHASIHTLMHTRINAQFQASWPRFISPCNKELPGRH